MEGALRTPLRRCDGGFTLRAASLCALTNHSPGKRPSDFQRGDNHRHSATYIALRAIGWPGQAVTACIAPRMQPSSERRNR